MLNYRNTSVVFLILTLVYFISGIYTSDLCIVAYCIIVFIYLFILIAGASRIQNNFYLKAVHSGNPVEAKVTLTFDDGPDNETTPVILEILKKHRIKASFFCIGNKMENNKTLLKRISDEGHIIGNHSWSHAFLFDFFPLSKWSGR
ncbi:MAG: polysaccharide deacetylase family protein [Bacteroidales bacterium]